MGLFIIVMVICIIGALRDVLQEVKLGTHPTVSRGYTINKRAIRYNTDVRETIVIEEPTIEQLANSFKLVVRERFNQEVNYLFDIEGNLLRFQQKYNLIPPKRSNQEIYNKIYTNNIYNINNKRYLEVV